MKQSDSLQILLVEDSPSQRAVLAEYCRVLPEITLHEASDGSWALRLCRELPQIDLVITDLNMPGMDGVEFIQHLSRHTQLPPLLLISADVPELLENSVRAAEALGFPAVSCMKKPVRPEVFLSLIKKLLEQHKIHLLHQPSGSMSLAEIIFGLANNQFCAYYQPIYRQEDGRAAQVEALARWHHPEKGLLLPGVFIDRLESEGHIQLLTRRMVQSSFDLLSRPETDPELKVSLNLSRSLLQDSGFFDWLLEQAHLRELDTGRVVLEITETMAFSDLGHTLATLVRLRMRGFELSMDDFGTGHTNLEQLKDLPLSEIKFDRSLIKGIHRDARNQAIVDGMARIARELSLRMVAEGLDNEQDHAYLHTHYPDVHLQGFLLARPVPQDVLGSFLYLHLPARQA